RIDETLGITLNGAENTPETVAARFAKIADPEGQEDLANAFEQTKKYVANAARARGLTLDWG
ncbi:MAG: 3-oxoacyl-ACP reductase, partial [Sedimentitalea sp.]|nr:3-oxoacyl-ACP reductase [Sedimentitalea sp.]